MKVNDRNRIEFLSYYNYLYKSYTLAEVAALAKQGEKEAQEEYYARIQNVLVIMSNIYGNQTKIPAEDFLDEFYAAAKKAIVTYNPLQGDYVRFLRSYLANAARWYIAKYNRMAQKHPLVYSYDSIFDDTPADVQYTLADPDSPTSESISKKMDNEKYFLYAKEYIAKYLNSRDQEIIKKYIVDNLSPRQIAGDLQMSFSGIYRHLNSLFRNMNEYISNCEKRESVKIILEKGTKPRP